MVTKYTRDDIRNHALGRRRAPSSSHEFLGDIDSKRWYTRKLMVVSLLAMFGLAFLGLLSGSRGGLHGRPLTTSPAQVVDIKSAGEGMLTLELLVQTGPEETLAATTQVDASNAGMFAKGDMVQVSYRRSADGKELDIGRVLVQKEEEE